MIACAKGSDGLEAGGGDTTGGGRGGAGGASASSTGGAGSPSSASGASPASSGSSGSDDGGAMCDYAAPNTCATGTQMADVPGDAGAAMQVQHGTTSQWLTIRIVETEFDPVSRDEEPLSYTATLKSPPGMVFDLFVQEGPNDGGAVCNAAPVMGTGAGDTKTVVSTWNDNISFGDDKDDHRYLSIEVRYVSGTACGPAAQWTLTVAGHT